MTYEFISRNLAKLDSLLELELQEMTEFLKNRRSRLDNILELLEEVPEEAEEALANSQYELLLASRVLSRLLHDLPPYSSNKA